MRIEPRHNNGQIILNIIAESAADRTILALFNHQNNDRFIICNSTHEKLYHSVIELTLSGLQR